MMHLYLICCDTSSFIEVGSFGLFLFLLIHIPLHCVHDKSAASDTIEACIEEATSRGCHQRLNSIFTTAKCINAVGSGSLYLLIL